MKVERIHQVYELLKERKRISLDELCEIFSISKNTIRRDVAELEEMGVIQKVYGGIILKESNITALEPFSTRELRNIDAKKKIAETAATLVNDHEVIYIDSGTTTMHLLPHFAQKQFLTVVTASIYVLDLATSHSNLNVIATGGSLLAPVKAFVGSNVLDCIRNYNFSKIFLACEIKGELMKKACPKYLLVDHSKFDVASLMTYSDLKNINCIVTDSKPADKFLDFFKRNNIRLILTDNE